MLRNLNTNYGFLSPITIFLAWLSIHPLRYWKWPWCRSRKSSVSESTGGTQSYDREWSRFARIRLLEWVLGCSNCIIFMWWVLCSSIFLLQAKKLCSFCDFSFSKSGLKTMNWNSGPSLKLTSQLEIKCHRAVLCLMETFFLILTLDKAKKNILVQK